MSSFCSQCGAKRESSASGFCSQCGAKQAAKSGSEARQPNVVAKGPPTSATKNGVGCCAKAGDMMIQIVNPKFKNFTNARKLAFIVGVVSTSLLLTMFSVMYSDADQRRCHTESVVGRSNFFWVSYIPSNAARIDCVSNVFLLSVALNNVNTQHRSFELPELRATSSAVPQQGVTWPSARQHTFFQAAAVFTCKFSSLCVATFPQDCIPAKTNWMGHKDFEEKERSDGKAPRKSWDVGCHVVGGPDDGNNPESPYCYGNWLTMDDEYNGVPVVAVIHSLALTHGVRLFMHVLFMLLLGNGVTRAMASLARIRELRTPWSSGSVNLSVRLKSWARRWATPSSSTSSVR